MALTLRRGERSVVRSLTAGNCSALAEATAVIAAAACPALDRELVATPEVVPTPDAPANELPATPETIAVAVPEAPVERTDQAVPPVKQPARDEVRGRPRHRSRPGVELGARLAAAWGPTPAPALLVGAALRVQWPAFELLLALDSGPRRRVPATSGPAIDLRLATATIAGCPTLAFGSGRRRGHLSLCAGVEGGAMIGTGFGTPVTRTVVQPWLAALIGPSLTWSPHRRLRVGAAVDLAASLTRPSFILDGYALGFRAAATTVRLRMVFALRLR